MKTLRTLALLSSLAFASPAFATTVNLASPSGIMDVISDGTNNVSMSGLCGNNTLATILSACQSQVIVDTLGGMLVKIENANNNGAAVPGSSSPVVNAIMSHASTTALGTSLVAKASAGDLGFYNCTGIAGASAGYCIAYNGITAPSTGALTGANVLDFCYFDTTPRGCSLTRLPNSIAFSAGIVVLITSAASPYTYTTGTDTGAIEADYF